MILNFNNQEVNPKDFLSYGWQCLILTQAQKKGIDAKVLIQRKSNKKVIYILLKKDKQKRWISHQNGFFNSKLSCELALSKYLTFQALEANKLPVPQFIRINKLEQIDETKIPGPWVVKPIKQTMGRDVAVKIKTLKGLKRVCQRLFKKYKYLLIEQFIPGQDYRLLILEKKLLGAVRRIPARIRGDGIKTIKQLIEQSNKQRRIQAKSLGPFLKKIKLDQEIQRCLAQKKLKLSSVLAKDKIIQIRKNANFSTGGEARDVTESVHPDNIKLARKAIKALGLEIGGVDILAKDISQPIKKTQGKIIEINANPSLWIHHFPNQGKPRNATAKIINYLFK